MKRLILVSLLAVPMLLMGGFVTLTHSQNPITDLKPTFISPTPGLYVNGWPPFTVSYPKEWAVLRENPGDFFRVGGTRPGLPPGVHMPMLNVAFITASLPLEDWAKVFMPMWVRTNTDIKVLSDRPTLLKDGTPAREVEVECVPKYEATLGNIIDAPRLLTYILVTKRGLAWIWVNIHEEKARFG